MLGLGNRGGANEWIGSGMLCDIRRSEEPEASVTEACDAVE
jgi:hypothetical protein